MKIKIIFIAAALTLFTVSVFAQDEKTEKKEKSAKPAQPMNIIKVNLTALVLKNYSFQYERILNRKFSAAIGFRTMPTGKLPLLDWTTLNLRYQASYSWIGASRLAVELGNIIENGQQQEGTLQLDFNRLYQKSKWLRQMEQPSNIEDRAKWREDKSYFPARAASMRASVMAGISSASVARCRSMARSMAPASNRSSGMNAPPTQVTASMPST